MIHGLAAQFRLGRSWFAGPPHSETVWTQGRGNDADEFLEWIIVTAKKNVGALSQ
jgi:hypothetical protein